MTDQGDQEIIQMADDIKRKQVKQKEEDYEHERDAWHKLMIGRYFKEHHSGADNDAFKVYYVRAVDDFGRYLKTDEIQFSHMGHWHFADGSIDFEHEKDYTEKALKESQYIQEIDKLKYNGYIRLLFEKLGIVDDWCKETDH